MYQNIKIKRIPVNAMVSVIECDGTGPAEIIPIFPDADARPNRSEIRRLVSLGAGLDGLETLVYGAAVAERIDIEDYQRGVTKAEIPVRGIAAIDKRLSGLEAAISAPWTVPVVDRDRATETADRTVARYYDVDAMDSDYDGPAAWFRGVILARDPTALERMINAERERMIDSKARSILKVRTLDRINAISLVATMVSEHLNTLRASAAWPKLPARVRALVTERLEAMRAAALATAALASDAAASED